MGGHILYGSVSNAHTLRGILGKYGDRFQLVAAMHAFHLHTLVLWYEEVVGRKCLIVFEGNFE